MKCQAQENPECPNDAVVKLEPLKENSFLTVCLCKDCFLIMCMEIIGDDSF